MKIILFTFLLCCLTMICYSQDRDDNTFKYHSFSVSPLSVYFDSNTGGISFNTDLGFSYKKKHLFYLSVNAGSEFTLFGNSGDSFEQLNVFYGRKLKLNRTIYIDVLVGLGYFSFKFSEFNTPKRVTNSGVPLGAKLRFKLGKRFSLGLNFQANFNSVNPIYTSGILLQWNK